MRNPNHTDQQIRTFFKEEGAEVTRLLQPLMELSSTSSTLILGYGGGQNATRKEMLPYFHVCGAGVAGEPVRALIIGGWKGNETTSTYTIARLLASIEDSLRLVSGIEVTAYPIANLEARRAGVSLTEAQEKEGVTFWKESAFRHVKVLEHELKRYEYDLIILLREDESATDLNINLWPNTEAASVVLSDTLKRYTASGTPFHWELNPEETPFSRVFTPIPDGVRQPAEVVISLPAKGDQDDQANLGIGVLLTFLHAVRQARAEGVL